MSLFHTGMRVHAHRAGGGAQPKVLELVIRSVEEDQLVLAGQQFEMGDLDHFVRGRLFLCSTFRPDAMVTFEGSVLDAGVSTGEARIRLRLEGEPNRIQRRKWYRIERALDLVIQLPLENRLLGESLGRSWIETWWVRARLHNLSAGGLRLQAILPPGHQLIRHREAHLRLSLQDREDKLDLLDRRILFRRMEGQAEDGQLAYSFADLDKDESSRLHKLNVRHEQRQLKEDRRED